MQRSRSDKGHAVPDMPHGNDRALQPDMPHGNDRALHSGFMCGSFEGLDGFDLFGMRLVVERCIHWRDDEIDALFMNMRDFETGNDVLRCLLAR